MTTTPTSRLRIDQIPELEDATLVLAFSGWMDGGDVSTGTVRRIIDLVEAERFAEIDTEPFYLYNFPGSMEVASLFRPHIQIEDGLVRSVDMPSNVFYCHQPSNLVLFMGTEPHLGWAGFRDCIFELARRESTSRESSLSGHLAEPCRNTREAARLCDLFVSGTAGRDAAIRRRPNRI